jgi:elongation factor G
LEKGSLTGNPITGCRLVLKDGAAHVVDSSELAFRLATIGAFREAFKQSRPLVLEPIMTVEVVAPAEFQSAVIGSLNTRRGTIIDSEVREDEFTAVAEVALNDMFGYSGQLRGVTQGKGEFSMEYKVCSVLSRLTLYVAQQLTLHRLICLSCRTFRRN